MKKQLHIKPIVSLFSLFLLSISLQAQQFEWAKSYSGYDGMNNTDKYNRIYNSVFDSQGNIYIVGTMGENAILDTTHLSEGFWENQAAVILAKLDPQGNLLWHKSIKNTQYSQNPCWLQIVGDTSIAIMATMWSIGGNFGDQLWYLDTLLVGNYSNPPLYPIPLGYYNCFLNFDLNGNLKSQHFLQRQEIKIDGTLQYSTYLTDYMTIAPFHVDKNGYIYIYISAWQNDDAISFNLVVDNQTSYDCGTISMQKSMKILKLTPDFDLVWEKDIIKDTSGIGIDFTINSFNPFITGISADSEDNMYLTGYIERYRSNTEDTTFYKDIKLGNNKKLIINDAGCANLGFLIKYDTTGEPQWANQLYGKKNFNGTEVFPFYFSEIYNSTVNEDNNSVYIIARAAYDTIYCKMYLDDTTKLVFDQSHLINPIRTPMNGGVFFAKYNKETGDYLSYGTSISSEITDVGYYYNMSIAAKNNQVFSQVRYRHDLTGVDTAFTAGGITAPGLGVMRWRDDGKVIDVINLPINGSQSYVTCNNTILNDNGDLFITGMFDNTMSFGDITLIGSSSRSNAFMAKYHDSTFVHTYVEDTSSLLREINLEGKGITVYPNPTKGDVYITTQGEKINNYSLYNINGQLLLKSEKLKTTSEKINLSAFSKGVYIIKIITDKNVYSKKIIVN